MRTSPTPAGATAARATPAPPTPARFPTAARFPTPASISAPRAAARLAPRDAGGARAPDAVRCSEHRGDLPASAPPDEDRQLRALRSDRQRSMRPVRAPQRLCLVLGREQLPGRRTRRARLGGELRGTLVARSHRLRRLRARSLPLGDHLRRLHRAARLERMRMVRGRRDVRRRIIGRARQPTDVQLRMDLVPCELPVMRTK